MFVDQQYVPRRGDRLELGMTRVHVIDVTETRVLCLVSHGDGRDGAPLTATRLMFAIGMHGFEIVDSDDDGTIDDGEAAMSSRPDHGTERTTR